MTSNLRRIFIVRHGERVDFTFGNWIPPSFDESGKYVRKDLNMPVELPERQGFPKSFNHDGPITMVGETQARLLGHGLRLAGVNNIRHVFCSPSLRCLQTCKNILKGLQEEDDKETNKLKIAVEPGLFEWTAYYPDHMPQFLTKVEILNAGFDLKDHEYIFTYKELLDRKSESGKDYYIRSHKVVQEILHRVENLSGDVLLVAHGCSLDACSRQLVTGSIPTDREISWLANSNPYCSLLVVQEDKKGSWRLVEPPVPPMSHSSNNRYNWSMLKGLPPLWRTWTIWRCFPFFFRIFSSQILNRKAFV